MHLKLLDPTTDIELYRISYGWRPRAKRHVQPDRMSFDDFVAASIVVGLWAPEFCAVFVFCEFEPQRFECHFAAPRGIPRETLRHAAAEIVSVMLANGAERLVAWTVDRNLPTRRFVEALGFVHVDTQRFPCCNAAEHPDTLAAQTRNFVKYELSRSDPSG